MSFRPYIVPKLVPSNEISLIFGPPGVGKTRYLFQLVNHFLTGQPLVLDGVEFGIPATTVGYASFDRSRAAAAEILQEFDLHDKICWQSYRNVKDVKSEVEPVPLHKLPSLFPGCKLLIVDGLGMLIGDTNKYSVVSRYMRYAGTVCEDSGITMLGNLHSGKERSDSHILNPRQRSLGSTAFCGTTECQILMSHADPSDPTNPNRIVTWMPHTSRALIQPMTFNDSGFLVNTQELKDKYEKLLAFIPSDRMVTRSEVQDEADKLGIGKSQCDAFLKKCLEDSRLEQPDYGRYRRRRSN